jgi:DNA-binding SARP family transcriptional activator
MSGVIARICNFPQVRCARENFAILPGLPAGDIRQMAFSARSYLEAGDLSFAESVTHLLIAAADQDVDPHTFLIAQMLLGEVMLAKDRPQTAYRLYSGVMIAMEKDRDKYKAVYADALYGAALALYDSGDFSAFSDFAQLHRAASTDSDCLCMSTIQCCMLDALQYIAWNDHTRAMLKFREINGMRVATSYYHLASMLGMAETYIRHGDGAGAMNILEAADGYVGGGWGKGPFVAWRHRFKLAFALAKQHGLHWPDFSMPLSYLGTVAHLPRQEAKFEVSAFGLGGIRVRGKAIDWNARPMQKVVLVYLAMHPDGVDKEQFISDLWPEQEGDATLHTTLRGIRSLVGQDIVLYDNGLYSLTKDVWFDVHDYERLYVATRARELSERIDGYRQAIDLYQGPLLHGVYSSLWLEQERMRLASLQGWLLWSVGAMYHQDGQHIESMHFIDQALQINPLFDPAIEAKIRLLEFMGQGTEAIVILRLYEQRLKAQLGIDLSRGLGRLRDRLMRPDEQLTEPFMDRMHVLRASQVPMRGLPPSIGQTQAVKKIK